MTKEDQNFNWVKALQDCSFEIKFTVLRCSVEKTVQVRRQGLKTDDRALLEFQTINDRKFIVIRHGFGSGRVSFQLEANRTAVVTQSTLAGEELDKFTLTLTLNDDGECRFKIDGKGEYLPWQVERRALEDALFDGLHESK